MKLTLRVAVMGVLVSLPACSADEAQRSVYNSLRRYEETRPAPGEERRVLPTHDEYSRQRRGDGRG
jgi:hypothetical protein